MTMSATRDVAKNVCVCIVVECNSPETHKVKLTKWWHISSQRSLWRWQKFWVDRQQHVRLLVEFFL